MNVKRTQKTKEFNRCFTCWAVKHSNAISLSARVKYLSYMVLLLCQLLFSHCHKHKGCTCTAADTTVYPNSPPGSMGLTAHKGHWAQELVKLTTAAISVLLKWLSAFPYLPPQTVVTSSCSASLEDNLSAAFAVLTTLLGTDRLLLLVQVKMQW